MNDATEGGTVEDVLAEMSDDALAEMAWGLKLEGKRLVKAAGEAEFALDKRMRDRGATVLDTEHWKGKMKPQPYVHTVEDPSLLRTQLEDVVTPGDVDAAVILVRPAPSWAISQKSLNDLVKRGGRVAEIIAERRRSVRPDPRLVLERKEEVALEADGGGD